MQVAATPRGLVDPGPPPVPQKTLSRWDQFLGSIAVGVLLQEAMLKHHMTRADIESCVRLSHEHRQAWDDARLSAMKRGWSAFEFEDIFERIAGGMGVCKAIGEVKGAESPNSSTFSIFNRIVLADGALNEQYLAALKARSLALQEEVLDLADDKSEDTIENVTKWGTSTLPNNAAVNRSKLQSEVRLRLMGAWNTKMFGESKQSTQVNVQVNYAEKLEEARGRAQARSSTPIPALTQDVVEAAFKDMSPSDAETSNDMSWLDEPTKEPAIDTTWLEG
jgi:hypothetical protein